jgi:uncharacterized protein involved in exopolysaccharide biosynthesis
MALTVQELKEKFNTVQNISQSLKEEKIGLESELRTLQSDYEEQVKLLLEKTGASSFDEAVQVYKTRQQELEDTMNNLNQELTKYLDTYGEDANE